MTTRFSILTSTLLAVALAMVCSGAARADGLPGSVEFSDGKKISGAISLTPGKNLKLFTATAQVELQLTEIKQIIFKPEKEEMTEGFYFPNAGQATQAKTGEVYPTRAIATEITLADGKIVTGHLFTTMLYVETDDATEKVLLEAKQTGANGEKLTDLVYPVAILFDSSPATPSAGSLQIDLSSTKFTDPHPPVAVAMPDLSLLPPQPVAGKQIWTVPLDDSTRLLFSVEASDGVHVTWPEKEADPDMVQTVQTGLKTMRDFYDTRTLLGTIADLDAGDVFSLVMMSRAGKTYSFSADKTPWSLVVLRWKYDSDQKKLTLINRVPLVTGRAEGNSQPPTVFKQPELLHDITAIPAPAATPPNPNP